MPSKKCVRCHARFANTRGKCGPCQALADAEKELIEERRARQQVEAQLAAQRRYRVYVPEFYWKDERTWPEAVEFAQSVAESCTPYKVEVRAENGQVVRTYRKEGLIVKEIVA